VRQALRVTDRTCVMERGHIALTGTADEVMSQLDRVEDAYLSGAH
jgi:ABC-type branched-subunit amino acid transport system ATPase component